MGQYIILHDMPHADTQTWEAAVDTMVRKLSLSLAKPETAHPESGFLTPIAVRNLIDQQVQVFIQHGFGNHNPFADSDYADAGAEFTAQYADLAMLSHVVLKFDAFTFDQIALCKENQILFSVLSPENITEEYIQALNEKKITLFCLDLFHNDGGSVMEQLRKESLSDAGFEITLSNFLFPLVETLVHAPSIPYALQRAPELMQGILCHAGTLCHQQTAETLHLPWQDILSLCWNLN
jgi:alanine dehydrogenase